MTDAPDLICIAHLRWNFVFQRPQHLMTRAAQDRRVYYFEEPIFGDRDWLETRRDASGVMVCTPHVVQDLGPAESQMRTRRLLEQLVAEEQLSDYVLWIYTPMELPITAGLKPARTVYDCMDELANFRFAPPELHAREQQLFRQADLVFTGGYRLWEAKQRQHSHAYPFPSSVDVAHFTQARKLRQDPADQAHLPHPRLGFCGVLDERFDAALVQAVADARPEWQFVLVGPVVKVSPEELPQGPNIHYLGQKDYKELPAYMAGWDVALLPFARNEATEFISPTKTPEYLAAGRPVVSTSIRDVVRPYGEMNVVRIADDAASFEAAIQAALDEQGTPAGLNRQQRADEFLSTVSWDRTWAEMDELLRGHGAGPVVPAAPKGISVVGGAADD
ncbi:glycosyltransferase family 1 protein [Deinococcus sonorensis]|uniref:Glycosyltransferase family 1 protein n=2 Tax=Deinococcus sonorensis TaxID=309891 RepID=A0AAU7UE79_9DEIO